MSSDEEETIEQPPAPDAPLAVYEVGRYGDLRHRPNPAGLVFHFYVSLRDCLASGAQDKGTDLTPKQIAVVTLWGAVILLPREEAEACAEARGFVDLDPEAVLRAVSEDDA